MKLKTQIKTEMKYAKMMKQHPNRVGYVEDILQETKITGRKRISKVDAKQARLRQVKSVSAT
jgi:hypothetical protein